MVRTVNLNIKLITLILHTTAIWRVKYIQFLLVQRVQHGTNVTEMLYEKVEWKMNSFSTTWEKVIEEKLRIMWLQFTMGIIKSAYFLLMTGFAYK